MRKTALHISLVLGLVISVAVVAGFGQKRYRVDIPFDFTVNQKSYEAGKYFVDVLNSDSARWSLAIRSVDGTTSHIIMTTLGEDHSTIKRATLVFGMSQDRYALKEISTPSFIAKLPGSKAKSDSKGTGGGAKRVLALSRSN